MVHDDLFSTVSSTPDSVPDFNSGLWKDLFGSAKHHLPDNIDNEAPSGEDLVQYARDRRQQEMTASRFDACRPSTAIPVPPPPTTQLCSTINDKPNESSSHLYDNSDFVLVDYPEERAKSNRSQAERTLPEGVQVDQEINSNEFKKFKMKRSNSTPSGSSQPEGVTVPPPSRSLPDSPPALEQRISAENRQVIDTSLDKSKINSNICKQYRVCKWFYPSNSESKSSNSLQR